MATINRRLAVRQRIIACLIIGWFIAGAFFAFVSRAEPYPAISMPGFAGIAQFDSEHNAALDYAFEYTFDDGSSRTRTPREVFAGFPRASVSTLMRRVFAVPEGGTTRRADHDIWRLLAQAVGVRSDRIRHVRVVERASPITAGKDAEPMPTGNRLIIMPPSGSTP